MTATRGRHTGDFPALDGLRIVAVGAVVATHVAFWTGRYTRGTGQAMLAHLDVGVAVFFVISGFLISREWLTPDRDTGGLPRLGRYALRRGLRILPMYWLTVLVVFLAIPANHERSWTDWLRHLLLLQAYGADRLTDGLTQTWSLCTEVSFYAAMPALAWVIVRLAGRRERVAATAVVVSGVLSLASFGFVGFVHSADDGDFASAGYWLPSFLGWFLAGTALAAIRLAADTAAPHSRWRLVDAVGDSPGVCVLVGLAAFAVAVSPLTGSSQDPFPSPAEAVTKNVLYLVVGAALVTPAVLGRGTAYDAILGHRVMRYLGRISYSVFLVHLALIEGIQHLLGNPQFSGSFAVLYGWTLAASIALSAVTYRFVERPAVRFAHRGRRAHTIAEPVVTRR